MQNISVLIVDDETLILIDVEDALRQGGYATVAASNGEDAIVQLESRNDIRALVTDINLGGEKTGWAVARAARVILPAMPVVYVTSVPSAEWSAQGVPKSILIGKPFAPAQITTAISQLLNGGDAPSEGSQP